MFVLSYILTALPFAIAVGMAVMILTFVVISTRSPWVVIIMTVVAFIAETASIHPLSFNIGLWIYPGDAVAIFAAAGLFFRVGLMGKAKLVPEAWWIFGAVQFVLFAWGITVYGTGAGVDYRVHFAAWVIGAYLTTFAEDEQHVLRLCSVVQWIAVGVMAVAVYRWILSVEDPLFAREIDFFITTGVPFRVIWSAPTLMIAIAMLVSIFHAATTTSKAWHWPLALLFALFVLVLQHRSVWVAGLAGLGTLAYVLSKGRNGVGMKMAAIGIAIAVVVGVAATSMKDVSTSIQSQTERALGEGGTFQGGRVTSWVALLKDWATSGSPTTYLIGKPFGSGYERYTSDSAQKAVTYQPHNYYIQLLYRGGLIGLSAFLWVLWYAAKVMRRRMTEGDLNAPLVLTLLGTLVVFYIPYGVTYEQGILLALLLGVIGRERAVKKTSTDIQISNGVSAVTSGTKSAIPRHK
jgi:hypothetical protein